MLPQTITQRFTPAQSSMRRFPPFPCCQIVYKMCKHNCSHLLPVIQRWQHISLTLWYNEITTSPLTVHVESACFIRRPILFSIKSPWLHSNKMTSVGAAQSLLCEHKAHLNSPFPSSKPAFLTDLLANILQSSWPRSFPVFPFTFCWSFTGRKAALHHAWMIRTPSAWAQATFTAALIIICFGKQHRHESFNVNAMWEESASFSSESVMMSVKRT